MRELIFNIAVILSLQSCTNERSDSLTSQRNYNNIVYHFFKDNDRWVNENDESFVNVFPQNSLEYSYFYEFLNYSYDEKQLFFNEVKKRAQKNEEVYLTYLRYSNVVDGEEAESYFYSIKSFIRIDTLRFIEHYKTHEKELLRLKDLYKEIKVKNTRNCIYGNFFPTNGYYPTIQINDSVICLTDQDVGELIGSDGDSVLVEVRGRIIKVHKINFQIDPNL